jgi:GT2 family glycosyltransferase
MILMGGRYDMFISIIVITNDRYDDLKKLISNLSSQSLLPDELIIVDSSDSRKNIDTIENSINNTHLIRTNLKGTSVQRNIGIKNLDKKSNIVMFLDDDMILDQEYIKVISSVFEGDTEAVIGGLEGYLLQDGKLLKDKVNGDEVSYTPSLYGCNMSFRVSAIKNIYFDEKLALYGWLEDWDFSFTVSKNYKLLKCNRAYGYHMQSPKSRVNGEKLGYVQIANRYYLNKKHGLKIDYFQFVKHLGANLIRSYKKSYLERFYGNVRALYNVVLLGKDL